MKLEKTDFSIYEVVREGGASIPYFNEGRMYPVVIVDFRDNMAIPELFEYHNQIKSGDALFQWSLPLKITGNYKEVYLRISFKQPIKIKFGLSFKLDHFAIPIDGIIQSRGLVIQSGMKNDMILIEEGNKNIIVEIPELDFDKKWNNIYIKNLTTRFRKLDKLSKKKAQQKAIAKIKETREIWNVKK